MKINKEIEFETLHSNKHRIYLLCGIVCVVVLMVTLIITTSIAKYRTTQSMPLINGTINYDLSDLNLIGVYIQEGEEYVKTDTIPTSGYEFNSEESYCIVNGENINATINFDIETQTLSVVPLTKKGTKCYLYFDEHKIPAGDTILAASRPQAQTTDWTNNGQGVTYYYTGANPNNWVQFAGFWWRIIRINGDGSIRMIYQGTSANTTGSGTQTGTSAFHRFGNHKTFVGLVYDGSTQHGSGLPSTIMTNLNNWYNSNLANYEKDYIDTGAGFCSDRNMASGSNFNSSGTIYYAPYDRRSSGSLQCNELDVLSQDNGKLPNPIGLLTSDEYVLAGKADSYLNTGRDYWTMSPYSFYSTNNGASVFNVHSNGYLGDHIGYYAYGVRPVINIKADAQITGSGTSTDPFKVVGAS